MLSYSPQIGGNQAAFIQHQNQLFLAQQQNNLATPPQIFNPIQAIEQSSMSNSIMSQGYNSKLMGNFVHPCQQDLFNGMTPFGAFPNTTSCQQEMSQQFGVVPYIQRSITSDKTASSSVLGQPQAVPNTMENRNI